MPSWTKEQSLAIELEGKNIIVSAGAGSGKTAVLTERVIRKLKTGVHINELLVLTFTNAAAAEMKDRIRSAIIETKGLEEEANLIDGAYITTFDSFALSMVKKYHTNLNISNNIKITDEVVINLKKQEILDEIFEENYLSPKEDFSKLIKDFCLKDDKTLKTNILNIYKKIELKYDKDEYLNNYVNDNFTSKKINKYLEEYLNTLKIYQQNIIELLKDLNNYFDGDYLTKVEENLYKLINATSYEEFKISSDIKLPPLPKNSDPEGKKIKDNISKLKDEIKNLCIYETTKEMEEEILSTKSNVITIVNIIKELNKRLSVYKQENEIYNFTDIAHLAIKVIIENPSIKEELTSSFNEIMVDEYQDTSDTQELFISLISNNNVYMVGDIKQSIYRFRNANPYIFKNKYDKYRDTDEGIKIDLVKNFRSREEVLSNINLLFDLIMDDEIGGANYKESHRMVFGNNTYIEEGKTNQNYNLDVLTYTQEKKSEISKDEQEAFIIGNDIKEKIINNYQIFDKNKKEIRPANYSDFVILLDKSKNFDLYKRVFEYLHIPLNILKDESLSKDQDILVIKSLLKLLVSIKNNNYDNEFKYSFISVSRSFLFKTTDEEIYNYYISDNYKESELFQKCLKLVEQIDIMSPSEYLNYILEELEYEEKLITIGNMSSYLVREEYLYNLINDFEKTGNTIYDFITYLDEIYENEYDLKFSVNKEGTNSCKIMTIHKSKGLEFPICYFASFSNRFNLKELNERVLFDNKYGIILPKVDEYYKDTILKTLLKKQTREEEISEKIRLLYVALTRAKEKMILVLPEQTEEQETLNNIPIYEKLKYNSFLSIINSIYSVLLPYITKVESKATKEYQNNIKNLDSKDLVLSKDNLIVNELNIETKNIEENHFSKGNLHLITKEEQDKMTFGTKAHELLEQIDFKTYQSDNSKIGNKVLAFINSELIRKNINNKMYKEYEFTYQEDNIKYHGIIDLLIETPTEMIIVDYKLKNTIDDAYDNQLNGYRKFIEKKTNKPATCYLYSIIDETFREVKR